MDYISGKDRTQMQFLALEQVVAEDSWARVIDLFVDVLPLNKLGFKHTTLQKEGRPPYDPSALLKLYLYGYKHAIRSTRKLEHSCKVNVELWWLLKGLRPSFRSIAYFRKDNASAIKAAFRHFVLMLQDLKLIEGETIAIDSFKIRAQNSMKNNYSQKKIDRHIAYIDSKIEEYEQQLDSADATEQEELAVKITYQKGKRDNYKSLEKQLNESEENQISLTDKDAKAVMVGPLTSTIGYCIQAATDSKHKLFVHADIGGSTDQKELAPVALEVKSLLGLTRFRTLSDAGYTTGNQLTLCKAANILTYSSPNLKGSRPGDYFPNWAFNYKKDEDCYVCPSDEKLFPYGNWKQGPSYKTLTYANLQACKGCTIKANCTKSKRGREIVRSEYQEVVDENNKRVLADPDYYRKRQQIIEHQFGTLKRQWGFTFTLMKGKINVLTETNLFMLIYNLTRAASIMGPDELKKKLKGFLASFFKVDFTPELA